MSDETAHADVLEWTAQIVSAHASNNTIPPDALPSLIQDVYRALLGLGAQPEVIEKPQPAVPVKKSVFGDYIVCLEDGKKLKMLKRHLKTAYNPTSIANAGACRPTIPWSRRTTRVSAPRSPRKSDSEPSRAPP
jgi:predicted transcriptional regulator